MSDADPLELLGTRNCPSCLMPMDLEGHPVEYVTDDDASLVVGDAWWQCSRCHVVLIAD